MTSAAQAEAAGDWDPTAVPAATVVVLRDGAAGLEVLMVRRDAGLAFAGGAWVFPGGRIDPADEHPSDPVSGRRERLEAAARRAAAREAAEEAGLRVDPAALLRWSHWTPPPESPKRFSTAFFAVAADDGVEVVVDGGEITEHRWVRPLDALARRDAGEVTLTPPTFITLTQLGAFGGAAAALAHAAAAPHEHFATRVRAEGATLLACYHGDVRYPDPDPGEATVGPQHRLVMGERWTYRRDPSTLPRGDRR